MKDDIIRCFFKSPKFAHLIFEDLLLKQIKRALRMIEINHLKILEKTFSISQSIHVVHLVSNTATLKVHSLLIEEKGETDDVFQKGHESLNLYLSLYF